MTKSIVLNGRSLSYELERKRVKNINLRVRRDGSVFVSASNGVPLQKIEEFMRSKAGFILRARERMLDTAKENEASVSDRVTVLGEVLALEVKKGSKNQAQLCDGAILLTVKDETDVELIRKTLLGLLDRLCKETVAKLCLEASERFERFGVSAPKIRFRRMRTRWGSCNPKSNTLNFNLELISAPRECIEYVVYHEFTHLLHPDHSKKFHERLQSFIPDEKERRKRLNSPSAK